VAKRKMKKKSKKINQSNSSVIKKQQDFTIVINGGSTQMLDATIPVKWFFSSEFIKKEPKYILLVDLNQSQLNSRSYGERYVYSVDEVLAFIQTHRSGHHIMLALAFNDKKEALSYLQYERGSYRYEIDPSEIKDGENWGSSLATTFVEFDVPKELFAQPPESKLGKLWWKYLFWPNSPQAVDECQIRKLNLFFALPKLPFFVLSKVFLVLFFILYAFYNIIARPSFLFFGWWPITLKEMLDRIKRPQAHSWDMDVREGYYLQIYKNGEYTGKHMIISPFMFLSLLLSLVLTVYLMFTMRQDINFLLGVVSLFLLAVLSHKSGALRYLLDMDNDDSFGSTLAFFLISFPVLSLCKTIFFKPINPAFMVLPAIGIGIGLLIIVLIIVYYFKENKVNIKKFFKRKTTIPAETEKGREEKKKLEYQKYLQEFTSPEASVTIKNLPGTFESSRLKRDARIKFWAVKTKVCRPYER